MSQTPASATFSPRLVAGLVVAAALAAGLLVALSTFHDELGGGMTDNGGADAISRSAIGYSGLADLINDSGGEAVISRDPASNDASGLLILAPAPGPGAGAAKAIQDLEFSGPQLAIVQKWQTAVHRDSNRTRGGNHPNWVDKVRPFSSLERGQVLGDLAPGSGLQILAPGVASHHLQGVEGGPLAGKTFVTGPIDQFQTLKPAPDLHPVLVDETGAIVIGRVRNAHMVAAEPDLFANHGLKDAQGADTAIAILDALDAKGGPIQFDVTLNGFASAQRGLGKALLTPPLLPATLCLVLAAMIMAGHAFGRFGPAKAAGRVFAFGKRALADNTAALIHLARRERSMAAPYATLTRDLVMEAVGAPRDMPADQGDAFLDRLGVTRGVAEPWTALKAEAAGAANSDDLARSAGKLFNWRLEMTRERR
ncbi:MAG: hypothetical protein JWM33_202 [Caulobacteraceae bacterium]|nr:hypothetical protein [Caulobacteraceae bacterium]